MKRYRIAAVQYLERLPKEEHYLYIVEDERRFSFLAGEVIGQGFGAGGGEASYDIQTLKARKDFKKFIDNIRCPWIDQIFENIELNDNQKYLAIIEYAKSI